MKFNRATDTKRIGSFPPWEFYTDRAIEEDMTKNISQNAVVGLEMELDYKGEQYGRNSEEELSIIKEFGFRRVSHSEPCPVCGDATCWKHTPDNLIRTIKYDGSIHGLEFIIYGSNITSEEFARRLPMDKLRRYFKPTASDGLHVHLLIVHDLEAIPEVIVANMWQLFRFFYPGIIYLFGNQNNERFIRGTGYASIGDFATSPTSPSWWNFVGTNHGCAFNKSRVVLTPKHTVSYFDLEIRTPDATLSMNQLVAVRSIMKAMLIYSAELSQFGLVKIDEGKRKSIWETSSSITQCMLNGVSFTIAQESEMKILAGNLIDELSHILTPYERDCSYAILENPVRKQNTISDSVPIPKVGADGFLVKRAMTTSLIRASSEDLWIKKVSEMTGAYPSSIKNGMKEIRATFDEEAQTVRVM